MRVLHVINRLTMGGAECLLADLVMLQSKLGIDVEIVTAGPVTAPLAQKIADAGVPVRFAPSDKSYSFAAFSTSLVKTASRRFDVVHAHLFPSQLWVALARPITSARTAFVCTEHSTYNRRRQWPLWIPEQLCYMAFDRVICISAAVEDALRNWSVTTRQRTVVVSNGVDLDRFAFRPKPTLAPRPALITVGRLAPAKGLDTLLHAVSSIPEVDLRIVGEGPDRPALEHLIKSLGLAHRVQMLGMRTDIPALLNDADIYVQASRWEGFGIAALEAMAAGLPIVATDVPGLGDVVGDLGSKARPDDPESLVTAIREVLALSPQARQARVSAARMCAETYGMQRHAEAVTAVYETALRSRRLRTNQIARVPRDPSK